ncbi:DUF4292 domain-containing protein [Chryseobacterium koreense]|uniref:Deoxyuridine 5'-triphosphate nucleotidohydrolase n=1 Tax=Chryseobacterium koreense CCUG 49689 TaxID=1304281 RepID=A0A0J7IZ28_9FLAO|nr:DUF4292 domain-containing protein [Chryseobacterium koreense]KMQ71262.1 hypothetical protein ACM44_07575 [Chryseobacterium koreense CCUG 49689]MBB5333849.1 hypothetical protein [Chryseobacterium koreense]
MKKYILALLTLTFVLSCKTKSAVQAPISTTTPISSTTEFFNKIKAKPDFQQVKINSRVSVETGNFIPTLDATIYIENGQKVWMNMVAIILNVGRGIATPEGIRGYEKWNRTYIESDFTYLNNLMNVNFIDFNSLQNLLLGRTFIPVNEKDFVLTKNAQGYNLSSTKNLRIENKDKISEYAVSLDYSADFDLMRVNLNETKTGDNLEITYADYEYFENMKMPKNVKIIIKGAKTSQILMENTKFDSSRMDTPYSVPNNYTKTEIR